MWYKKIIIIIWYLDLTVFHIINSTMVQFYIVQSVNHILYKVGVFIFGVFRQSILKFPFSHQKVVGKIIII